MKLFGRGTAEDQRRRHILEAVGGERRSGFEIAELLAAAAPPASRRDESDLYPSLHRLETDGQLDAAWGATASGRTRRTYRRRHDQGRP